MASQTPTEQAGDGAATTPRPGDAPLPPGPDGYPVVGSALPFVRDPFSFYDTLASHGDVVRWRIPGFTYTTLFHPDHVEQVLVEEHDRFDRSLSDDFGLDFAPEGLLLTDGEQWRRQRRLLQPAFTLDRIQSYADTMVDHAERLAGTWTDGQEVALNRAFSGLTLRILAQALFDVAVTDEDDEAVTRAARAINERADVQSPTSFLPTWVPTPRNLRYRRAMRDYRTRMDELVDQRRETGHEGEDLLSILLHAEGEDGETLSEAEVRDNLLTFLFAGHETTALGLTYAVLLLAQHEGAADSLRTELETVLDGERPAASHVPQLAYTEQVVRETLRLHPPAHLLFRRATEDVVVGGYRVPEGTVVTLPQFWLHTDERFYDAPDAFRPERWTDEFEAELPDYAFFPFGGGPRHCIGMRFAMLELQLVVAVLADAFEFELLSDPDPAIAAGATHQPKEDVRVRVHRR